MPCVSNMTIKLSASILLPVVNLSPEMDSATSISYTTEKF